MKRRVLLLATAAALLPFQGRAQSSGKTATIGFIAAAGATAFAPNFEALRRGLRDHGYIEGRNLRIEARYADGRLERLAKQLSAVPVDILVTAGSHVTRVVRKTTRDIPIVMAYAGDPVGGGLVDSLSRPGGRITGLTTLSPQLAGKRLELLKEALQKLKEVGVVWNPEVPERVIQFKETQAAAGKLRIPLHSFEARSIDEIGVALKSASSKPVDAVIVMNDALLQSHQKKIVDLAINHRLPTLYQEREASQLGGLMSYGPSFPGMHRRAATYVDKILQGAKPGDLPIEQPTTFELVINLKAAKALGVAIPRSVLVRADEVIQ
jgi:putative tryptophan/tyrosine transport system substrate-binding protein